MQALRSLAIGLVVTVPMDPRMALLIATGLLGGYTTFSTFSIETIRLVETGRHGWAVLYVLASVAGGLGAAWMGTRAPVALRFPAQYTATSSMFPRFGIRIGTRHLLIGLFLCQVHAAQFGSALGEAASPSRVVSPQPALRTPITHVPSDLGLSQNVINCSVQDRIGFLWFGTKDGLNRFDGYRFRVFRHDPNDPSSLSDSYVTSAFEDSRGRLWIGTARGLNLFDTRTETSTRISPDDPDSRASLAGAIDALVEDRLGSIWFLTEQRLFRLAIGDGDAVASFDGARVTRYPLPTGQGAGEEAAPTDLIVDDGGIVWANSRRGLFRLEPDSTGTGVAVSRDPVLVDGGLVDSWSMSKGRDGRIWLGGEGALYEWDTVADRVRVHAILSKRWIVESLEDRTGMVWIFTIEGLLRLDPHTGAIEKFPRDPESPQSPAEYGIRCLLEDRAGAVWLGSNGNGLFRYDRTASRFSRVRAETGTLGLWHGTSLRSICETDDGALLVGTTSGTVLRVDRRTGVAVPMLDVLAYSMLQDRTGDLWIGGQDGLVRMKWREAGLASRPPGQFFNVVAQRLRGPDVHWIVDDVRWTRDRTVVSYDAIRDVADVFEDRDGTIWIATDHKLVRFDRVMESFTDFPFESKPSGGSFDRFTTVHQTPDGTMWIGASSGLYRFEAANGTFTRFHNDPGNPSSLSHDVVRAIAQDPAFPEVLWLGTSGGGLNRFDTSSGLSSVLSDRDGLPNNVVYAILTDDDGMLWISTNNGISRLDPRALNFRNFDIKDGLQDNEFNACASFRGRSGELFFGGINGYNAFVPADVRDDPTPPPVVITDFRIMNRSVSFRDPESPLTQSITSTREISVSYEQRFISFEFAALDYTEPSKNQYAYRLEGFDPDWVNIGTERTAVYTNVPPGGYVLHVIAANSDGVWNREGARIRVTVVPPFWRAWWFLTLVSIGLVAAVVFMYRRRVSGLRRRQEELEFTVSDRTRALAESVALAQKQADTLAVTVEQLKISEHNAIASQQRAYESERIAIEASKAKSTFLSSMSHELRTPLNAVLGFAQLIGRDARIPPEQQENLAIIQRSGEHLLGLINDVLSISKIEAGKLLLDVAPFDLAGLLRDVCDIIRIRAETKGLSVEYDPGTCLPATVLGDEGKLRQVLVNLLGNAVKFTESGSVTLTASWSDGRANFEVVDTGVGISGEELGRLFEPFVQTESGQRIKEGTGLGLVISRKIVCLMGGDISVESRPGHGSRFAFDVALPETGAAVLDDRLRVVECLEPGQPSPRILVVDDTAENRILLTKLLEVTGFDVRDAVDGAQGLDVWSAWRPDLVFMDIRMPVVDGHEATARIRDAESRDPAGRRTIVVALTASAFEHERNEILVGGADDFVAKPFREATIFETIARHLGVRYVYRSGPNEIRAAIGFGDVLTADRIAAISRPDREALYEALSDGDTAMAARVADRIRSADPALTDELIRAIRNFKVDELLSLLERSGAG